MSPARGPGGTAGMPERPARLFRRFVPFVLVLITSLLAPRPARVSAANEPPAFDADSARASARALTPAIPARDAGTLWARFNKEMRGALRDSANLAQVLRNIEIATGPLDSVTDEQVKSPAKGAFVYTANGHFRRLPVPWTILFAFDEKGRVSGMYVRPGGQGGPKPYESDFVDYETKTTLRLPFDGEWTVVWGGRTVEQNYHAEYRDQRFAMDLLVTVDGKTHKDQGRKLTDYYCYGRPILAPAAGVVVWSQDSLPDNEPGQMDKAHPAGNAILIDHGNGEYSLLAHLQPRTLKFHTGERVGASDVIGLCGNSGNTSEPHLHYHLQNAPTPFDADGLPAPFTNLIIDGKRAEKAELVKGQFVERNP